MLRFVPPLMLLVAGVIHLLPITGVLGKSALKKLYGVELADPNLIILMRHRAALFGILGAFMIAACFRTELRHGAFWVGLASALSFLAIARRAHHNEQLARVVTADVVAVVALVIGYVAELLL